ncbi:hypothetical protein BDN70DRAFT_879307 [Pholiota conissans]|uniref:Uncharacterized protein n=1 Tax=Pholiota conissans TaxID=109636 RepID=A0A9P6CT66_9AGAR|nr:hypothetical protein BDN70DRAFT_879307 [Pholiota conissans]
MVVDFRYSCWGLNRRETVIPGWIRKSGGYNRIYALEDGRMRPSMSNNMGNGSKLDEFVE